MNSKDRNQMNETSAKKTVTRLLQSTEGGNKEIVHQLLPYVYDEMRSIAHQKLRFERDGHTLDTTALVHEAYFKLVNHEEVEWQSRAHFLAVAALAMKRILMNYARKKKTLKRGGDNQKVTLENLEDIEGTLQDMSDSMADEILALNGALKKMEAFNQRGCRVVEYHFFGGLTWKEISEVMGIAPITVRRAWNVAKLWLRRELKDTGMPAISVKEP